MPADRLTDAELAAAIAECEAMGLPWELVGTPQTFDYHRTPAYAKSGLRTPAHFYGRIEDAQFTVESVNTRLSLLQELAELRAENARLKAGAVRIIKSIRFDSYGDLQWGPTPGVPGNYGYWWKGDYVGSIESALIAAGNSIN